MSVFFLLSLFQSNVHGSRWAFTANPPCRRHQNQYQDSRRQWQRREKAPGFAFAAQNHLDSRGHQESSRFITSDTDASNSNDNDIVLSDEELLLACRSYLQKRNRLGEWTQFEKRRENRQRQQELAKGLESGFFWDDPSELVYYQPDPPQLRLKKKTAAREKNGSNDTFVEEEGDEGDIEESNNDMFRYNGDATTMDEEHVRLENDYPTTSLPSSSSWNTRLDQTTFDFREGLEQSARDFVSFPSEPSETRIRRSQSAKKRWNDPAWKAQWYERRWGSQSKSAAKRRRNNNATATRGAKKTLEKLTMSFLASPEFVDMTDEEIAQAVQMYTQANEKRVSSWKRTLQERRASLERPIMATSNATTPKIPPNASAWNRDPQALERARQIRANRAQKTYKTRIENLELLQDTQTNTSIEAAPRRFIPSGKTTHDAMFRIGLDLKQGKLPSSEDLELISTPSRLSRRKTILRTILSDYFGLRGKCVPPMRNLCETPTTATATSTTTSGGTSLEVSADDNHSSSKLYFITTCTAEHLMAFTLSKVREVEANTSGQNKQRGTT